MGNWVRRSNPGRGSFVMILTYKFYGKNSESCRKVAVKAMLMIFFQTMFILSDPPVQSHVKTI